MSEGSVHLRASLWLAAGFSVGAMISQNPALLKCTFGALTGILLSGDLDVNNGNISDRIIKEKSGWFGKRLWDWFWYPYRESFKHGSFGSHCPGFSTFVRLFFIFFRAIVPFYLLALAILGFSYRLWAFLELKWWVLVLLEPMFFYGLASSDLIHFFLDILTTKHVEKPVTKHLGSFNHNSIKG